MLEKTERQTVRKRPTKYRQTVCHARKRQKDRQSEKDKQNTDRQYAMLEKDRQTDRHTGSQKKMERRPTKYRQTDRQRGREDQQNTNGHTDKEGEKTNKIQTDRQKIHVDLCLVTLTKGAKKLIALNFEKLASFFLPLTFAAMDL